METRGVGLIDRRMEKGGYVMPKSKGKRTDSRKGGNR